MKPFIHPLAILLFLAAGATSLFGQLPEASFYVPDIEVTHDSQVLPNPFAGGLEAPQFQSFHLNNDGLPDLLAFDRVGQILLPFLAEEIDSELHYHFAPEYRELFPELQHLFLLNDLNCDGLDDIISTQLLTSVADVKLVVYLQSNSPDGLPAFHQQDLRLQNGPDSLIRIHAFDLPALGDINGDELSDLLYIPIGGTTIRYFERVATGESPCDSLVYELADHCWGEVTYDLNTEFQLGGCSSGFAPSNGCAGSAMRLEDVDQDGDQDLYFSGIYEYHIQQLINGGTADSAVLISASPDWLRDGQELVSFPASFPLPTHQNREQLIIATNRISGIGVAPSGTDLLRFEKGESDTSWTMQEQQFLRPTMIDHGFRSSPTIWDVDQDGLQDLVIAYNLSHPQLAYVSGLAWYRNTGTAQWPAFTLADENFGLLYDQLQKALAPTFGDLDGDGVAELVTGLANGELITWRAIDGPEGEYELYFPNPMEGLEVDAFAKPQLVDADADGLLDLVCGSRSGITKFWRNTGSAASPEFVLEADTLGGIVPEGYYQENSAALVPEGEGYRLFVGQRDGHLAEYVATSWSATAELVQDFPAIDVGERASLVEGDLNGDDLPDLVVGNMRGGLQLYLASEPVRTRQAASNEAIAWRVYPNPVPGLDFQVDLPPGLSSGQLTLHDALGRVLHSWHLSGKEPSYTLRLPTRLSAGIYFLNLVSPEGRSTQRLFISQL